MTMKDRLPLVADLLMEAAHADKRLHGDEKDAVRRLLREILEVQALPMDVDFHIDEFDAGRFDRSAAVAAFAGDPPAVKRRLLELIGAVHAADDHMRAVGAALGLPPEAFKELVVDIVEEIDVEVVEKIRYGQSEVE